MLTVFLLYVLAKNISYREKAKDKYTVILNDLYEKIKAKSAEDIVLKEDFRIEQEYFKLIQPGKYITEYVEALASDILGYLNIKNSIDIIVFYDKDDRYASQRREAGYYRSNRVRRDIHVIVHKDYSCIDVASILCHEISHFYMELMNIAYREKDKNEEATDVMAIMLGFGKIIIKGYAEHQYSERIGLNTARIHKSKIGYISNRDCKIVYGLLKELKECEIAKRQTEIEINEIKSKTTKKLELASELYNKLAMIAQNEPTTPMTREDTLKLQDLYMKIESEYFSTQLSQFASKLLKSSAREDVEKIGEEIDQLCYDITLYNSLFLQ